MTERWRVDDAAEGERLDRHVAERADVSRSRAQAWIRAGRVLLDGTVAKPSAALTAGASIELDRPPRPVDDPRVEPEDGPVAVLWEDDDLAVVDKPAGLAVHPGAGRPAGTLANRLIHRWPAIAGVGGAGRPGIVHRLDLDTTGVLLVAKTERAHRALAAAFAERRVDKTYVAVVHGRPRAATGTVDAPIGRHPTERKQMTVRDDGRPATSRWRVLDETPHAAVLEVAIDTGRTHQIRVHLKSIGHPLIGDPIYGEARWRGVRSAARNVLRDFPRPALHALRLSFDRPGFDRPLSDRAAGEPSADGRRLRVEAPVPADLRRLWERLAGRPWPGLDQ